MWSANWKLRQGYLPRPPADVRFWSKVGKRGPEECWEWQANRNPGGYGMFAQTHAHRSAYSFTYGPIPDGLWVLHRCDNRPCCNPAHLFLGTVQDNVDDMISKGRKRVARGVSHGHCKLTVPQVLEIRRRYRAGGTSQDRLAAEFGVSQANIGKIVRGVTWPDQVLTAVPA